MWICHDASAGDIDNDGDIDIFACGIVMINDGFGYFHFHPDLNRTLQNFVWQSYE